MIIDPRKERLKRDVKFEIRNSLVKLLENKIVPRVIDIIMDEYNSQLNGVVTVSSELAPEHFMSEFYDRLKSFDFVKDRGRVVTFSCPDMENFDFSGDLEFIQTVLEGIVGTHVEVSSKYYNVMFASDVVDRQETTDRKPYLLMLTDEIRLWENRLGKKFRIFEFSNSSPKDIFSEAEKFVEDNLDEWIDEASDSCLNKISNG
jgi:hypothetical protein